jgi:hypothetical protein
MRKLQYVTLTAAKDAPPMAVDAILAACPANVTHVHVNHAGLSIGDASILHLARSCPMLTTLFCELADVTRVSAAAWIELVESAHHLDIVISSAAPALLQHNNNAFLVAMRKLIRTHATRLSYMQLNDVVVVNNGELSHH